MDLSIASLLDKAAGKLDALAADGVTDAERVVIAEEFAKIMKEALDPAHDFSQAEQEALNEAAGKLMNASSGDGDAYGKAVKDFSGSLRTITADDLGSGNGGGAPGPGPGDDGLTVSGNKIDTGRYEITVQEGSVRIYDRQTDSWVEAWGDPHLKTSDGDKGQFHSDSLTIDLQDGTKVTIKPTEVDSKGVAVIDELAVTRGDEAVVGTGFNEGPRGVTLEKHTGQDAVDRIDREYEDGTVMQVGEEVDDLHFTNGFGGVTEELVGGDASKPFGEHLLDGRGGRSLYGVEGLSSDGGDRSGSAPPAGGSSAGSGSGLDAEQRAELLENLTGILETLQQATHLSAEQQNAILTGVSGILQGLTSEAA